MTVPVVVTAVAAVTQQSAAEIGSTPEGVLVGVAGGVRLRGIVTSSKKYQVGSNHKIQ